MEITILGSGGGSGIPNAFCCCANCEAARAAGGKNLRNGPAVLVNDDLLIDCGPDVRSSIRRLGLRLVALRTLVITHRHSDHLDPWFFWERRGVDDTELPLLTVYAPQDILDEVFEFYQQTLDYDRATMMARTRTVWHPIRAGMMKLAGRYRLHFFQAMHGQNNPDPMEAVLVGVKDARAGYLHCYDTGPLSEAVWGSLAKHQFDVVTLDSCIGFQEDYHSVEHMTAAETVAHVARMREAGILKPEGQAVATHFVHHSPGTHEELEDFFSARGVVTAYDGLRLTVANGV